MKLPLFFLCGLTGALLCFGAAGCEEHNPAQTIPGYAEKTRAEAQAKATTAEPASTNAPAYFPPKP